MVAITGPQLRAARGMLDWTREELAKEAGVSQETIKNIEHGIFRPQESTTDAIVKAFAVRDVVFTDNEGVQVKKDSVIRYEGVDGFKKFMDDVYEEAKKPESRTGGDKQICVSNVDDRFFVKYLGEKLSEHAMRMNALKDVRVRALVKEDDDFKVPNGAYADYRSSGAIVRGAVPFYVYGDKFAILSLGDEKSISIIVISSSVVAKSYRDQFEYLWKNAKHPSKNITSR